MPNITVISRDGSKQSIDATVGYSLMEAIREAGISELAGTCGGACSCATCHVHVIDSPVDLSSMSDDEDDLLDAAPNRQANSRLSCQVLVEDQLQGLIVCIGATD